MIEVTIKFVVPDSWSLEDWQNARVKELYTMKHTFVLKPDEERKSLAESVAKHYENMECK